jgi:DNA-directed RNA polymerase
MTATISERRPRRRFARRSRNRPYVATDLGREVCGQILPALAGWMCTPAAPAAPEWLMAYIDELEPQEWALVALAPLLDQIDRGWGDDPSARMKICLAIGRAARDKLEMKRLKVRDPDAYDRVMEAYRPAQPDHPNPRWRRQYNKHTAINRHRQLGWTPPKCVEVGDWLLDCGTSLDFFDLDEDGFPKIADAHQAAIDKLREELIARDPVYLPLLEPPEPWTDWDAGGGPMARTFIRDSHPATEKAIREAFAYRRGNDALHAQWADDGQWPRFSHVDGVNHLQSVAWRINEPLTEVVRRFAGIARDTGGGVGKSVSRNQVWRDLETAKYFAGKPFWIDMNCDFRGRLYGIPHFNFLREDHVRSLFLFDQGMPIGDDAWWLMVHLANCYDERDGDATISKRPWDVRADWTRQHRDMIVRTARNPEETVDWWCRADAPFSFVAAAKEWVAAGDRGYITRLPITLDATCNGVQHLALLSRDEEAGRLVNLMAGDKPQDVFRDPILAKVIAGAERDSKPSARFWLANNRLNRKIVKRPASTFGYSVSVDGMRQQIVEEYMRQHENNQPPDTAAWYLAHRIMAACKEVLKKPAEVMDFIRGLAGHLASENLPLRWFTPTSLPVINGYYAPNIEIADLELRGERVRYRVANGWLASIDREGALNAAAPNYVHSLDSSHAVRVINAAAREGIANVATIHDCFASLVPQVERVHQLVRREFYLMYHSEPLTALRELALRDYLDSSKIPYYGEWAVIPMFPSMRYGSLDPFEVQQSEYLTS